MTAVLNRWIAVFDWKSLPANALVVDVGGGVGSVSMILARQCPDLRIVVQDRPGVVENGIQASRLVLFVRMNQDTHFSLRDSFGNVRCHQHCHLAASNSRV